jgi:hypothetical protein
MYALNTYRLAAAAMIATAATRTRETAPTYSVESTALGHCQLVETRHGIRRHVDTYRTPRAAQYAAELLTSGLATVNPHAPIGCRVQDAGTLPAPAQRTLPDAPAPFPGYPPHTFQAPAVHTIGTLPNAHQRHGRAAIGNADTSY